MMHNRYRLYAYYKKESDRVLFNFVGKNADNKTSVKVKDIVELQQATEEYLKQQVEAVNLANNTMVYNVSKTTVELISNYWLYPRQRYSLSQFLTIAKADVCFRADTPYKLLQQQATKIKVKKHG